MRHTATAGGLSLRSQYGTIVSNEFRDNEAHQGGGLHLYSSDQALLSENTIISNSATDGGGVYFAYSEPDRFDRNYIVGNSASSGGGIYVFSSLPTLVNNVVARNVASSRGGGVYAATGSPRFLHTTFAQNQPDGVRAASRVRLVNTILVSHTVGVSATTGGSVALEATLWGAGEWANETDWGGGGVVTTGTINIWEAPVFVDAAEGNYHIERESGATEAGVDAGIHEDIDGQTRPLGNEYDIGADEVGGSWLAVTKRTVPAHVGAGEVLTYTVYVTNTGDVTLTAIITDVLPVQVWPSGALTWNVVLTSTNATWVEEFTRTVTWGYSGTLVNRVSVAADEGAAGSCAITSTSTVAPGLVVSKHALADTVQTGEPLTYSIHITNTGSTTLTTVVTDTLWQEITPTLVLTWTAVISVPNGVWSREVIITAPTSYGLLTNTVQVLAREGVTGSAAAIVSIQPRRIYLPFVIRAQ